MSSSSVTNSDSQHNPPTEPFDEAFLLVTHTRAGAVVRAVSQTEFAGRVNNVLFYDWNHTRYWCHFDTETFDTIDYVEHWIHQRAAARTDAGEGGAR